MKFVEPEGINRVFIGLGSNMGDRAVLLESALNKFRNTHSMVVRASVLYETQPWGFRSSQWFLNQVALVHTCLSPADFLSYCLEVEDSLGRRRPHSSAGYFSRYIDIDILFYNSEVYEQEKLTIPHPGIPFRRFVLTPMAEIAGRFVHPTLSKSISQLLSDCRDQTGIHPYTAFNGTG